MADAVAAAALSAHRTWRQNPNVAPKSASRRAARPEAKGASPTAKSNSRDAEPSSLSASGVSTHAKPARIGRGGESRGAKPDITVAKLVSDAAELVNPGCKEALQVESSALQGRSAAL